MKPFQQHLYRVGTPERKEAQRATNAAIRAGLDAIAMTDPMERQIAEALTRAGIAFTTDHLTEAKP